MGDRWLGVLGELAVDDKRNVAKCITLARQSPSQDMMWSLFFVAHYIKRRHSEIFANEFANQLSHSWSSTGLLLILRLFDTDDTALLLPLKDYLDKLSSANATPELRAGQRQIAAALKSAIRKIEGKPEKRCWQFWR